MDANNIMCIYDDSDTQNQNTITHTQNTTQINSQPNSLTSSSQQLQHFKNKNTTHHYQSPKIQTNQSQQHNPHTITSDISTKKQQIQTKNMQKQQLINHNAQLQLRITQLQLQLHTTKNNKQQTANIYILEKNKIKDQIQRKNIQKNQTKYLINILTTQLNNAIQQNTKLKDQINKQIPNLNQNYQQLSRTENLIQQFQKNNEEKRKHYQIMLGSQQDRYWQLKEKLQEKDSRQKEQQGDICVICMFGKTSMGIYPCGHVRFCQNCIAKINNKCPLCKKSIIGKFRCLKNNDVEIKYNNPLKIFKQPFLFDF